MEVHSLLTGKRGVSLPFTDECPQIVPDSGSFQEMVNYVLDYATKAKWRYVEWRDGAHFPGEVNGSEVYYTHELSLRKTEKELFSNLRESTRRNIKKAIRAGVRAQIDHSLESIKFFCHLNCLTRKRHGLPPQPFSFFGKLFECVVSKGSGFVVSALHSGKVIASAVFFHFGSRAVYKYGASDLGHQDLRPNNLIMWEAIKWCRGKGFESFNFGRTEPENKGLLQFKRGWGAQESQLKYHRYDVKSKAFRRERVNSGGLMNKVFARTPLSMLGLLGRMLYRHAG